MGLMDGISSAWSSAKRFVGLEPASAPTASASPTAQPSSSTAPAQPAGHSDVSTFEHKPLRTDAPPLPQTLAQAKQSPLDGAGGISPAEYQRLRSDWTGSRQSDASIAELQKKNPALVAALRSGLDYQGYVGVHNGALNATREGDELHADAQRRAAQLDLLPPVSAYGEGGKPPGVTGGDPLGNNGSGNVVAYQTGPNTTKIVEGTFAIDDSKAQASRSAQRDFTAKMSGVVGVDVKNPPTATAARAYFQALADRGASPAHVQAEYGAYLKTFYAHAGEGVTWSPKLSAKTVDAQMAPQPILKDGRRVIDCEGFAVLTESILGGVKKGGSPMFDIKHASNGSHVVAGVFPRGAGAAFVVDNDHTAALSVDPSFAKDYAKANPDTQRRFLLRGYMAQHHGAPANEFGSTYNDMKPPS